jgi:hypothetical protein
VLKTVLASEVLVFQWAKRRIPVLAIQEKDILRTVGWI